MWCTTRAGKWRTGVTTEAGLARAETADDLAGGVLGARELRRAVRVQVGWAARGVAVLVVRDRHRDVEPVDEGHCCVKREWSQTECQQGARCTDRRSCPAGR